MRIESLQSDRLDWLCHQLSELSPELTSSTDWPANQLKLCGECGVFRWFIDGQWGGLGWTADQIVQGYMRLAASCLTTTFVITQRTAASKRIAISQNQRMQRKWLPRLADGSAMATVGISHLTTSRQHLEKPVLLATRTDSGWLLDGCSPWVTGGRSADVIVVGASHETGEQLLAAVPCDAAGIRFGEPQSLVALSASQTGPVEFDRVEVPDEYVLAGPIENVLQSSGSSATGSLQTSALALGLAQAAVDYVGQQAARRSDLQANSKALEAIFAELNEAIIAIARGDKTACSTEKLRSRANSFALRATKSALVAAKGAGFVAGHPVGRWCQEALFFLVWSCPQNVRDANLCEFAGIQG